LIALLHKCPPKPPRTGVRACFRPALALNQNRPGKTQYHENCPSAGGQARRALRLASPPRAKHPDNSSLHNVTANRQPIQTEPAANLHLQRQASSLASGAGAGIRLLGSAHQRRTPFGLASALQASGRARRPNL
jgi:hypothetical protein